MKQRSSICIAFLLAMCTRALSHHSCEQNFNELAANIFCLTKLVYHWLGLDWIDVLL